MARMESGSSEIRNHANLIWAIAELLRGDYKQADYGKVILPLVVIRRLDQALDPTKDRVIQEAERLRAQGIKNIEPVLLQVAEQQFYNASKLRFPQLLDDPGKLAINLRAYIDGFSSLARAVVENFDFDRQIDKLERANLLYQVLGRICEVDLHPARVSNLEMGYLFEELIRKFAEASNETAGEHFTPREVVRLMVNLLLAGDEEALCDRGVIRTVYDCACGTGGMLSEAEAHTKSLNPGAIVHLYGQELNPESYAICLADMLVKGQDASHIVLGNSFSQDGHAGERFHYGIANPPFGVDWSKVEAEVREEHERLGFDGRFGPGLPRKSDGQLLFQLHLLSKMRSPDEGGSRIAIVQNGSPLFSGGAGSGESRIRQWLVEEDLVEAIIALPSQLFYNTPIGSYVWILSNRKNEIRRGKVQLIDARDQWRRMSRGLGEKRREIDDRQIENITALYADFVAGARCQILEGRTFGYRTITVDRPLRGRWEIETSTWDRLRDSLPPAVADRVEDSLRSVAPMSMTTESECIDLLKRGLPADLAGKSSLVRDLARRCFVTDPSAGIQRNRKGTPLPDPALRDTETVPLDEPVDAYLRREVLPFAADAWCSDPAGRTGYEIPFLRLFPADVDAEPLEYYESEAARLEEQLRALTERVVAFSNDFADAAVEFGWPRVALKRICRILNGGTPGPDAENWGGDVFWATPTDLNKADGVLRETERTVTAQGLRSGSRGVPADSIVISTRAPIGTVAVTAVPTAFNQGCKGLLLNCARMTPDCLAFQLVAMKRELEARGQGTTFLELKADNLATVRVFMPPVDVQATLDFRAALDAFQQARRVAGSLIEIQRLRRKYLDGAMASVTGFQAARSLAMVDA